MAKANKPNKSQMIRDYLAAHPDARPMEVAQALSDFAVTPALVANIKARNGITARKERQRIVSRRSRTNTTKERSSQPGRRKKRPNHVGNGIPANFQKRLGRKQHDYDAVLLAVQLIRRCGGVDEAHAVLEKAARLSGVRNAF